MTTKNLLLAGLCSASALVFSSCSKESESITKSDEVSASALSQIKQMGFATTGATVVDGGYVVEGDIFLSNEDLANPQPAQLLRVGAEEQYRTTAVVSVLPMIAGMIRCVARARPSGVSGSVPNRSTTTRPFCTSMPTPMPSPASVSRLAGISNR